MTLRRGLRKIAEEMVNEGLRARSKFSPYNSLHEGYAVLLEEIEEFWKGVKDKQERRDLKSLREEIIQVGSVAMLIAHDLLGDLRERE